MQLLHFIILLALPFADPTHQCHSSVFLRWLGCLSNDVMLVEIEDKQKQKSFLSHRESWLLSLFSCGKYWTLYLGIFFILILIF